MTTGFNYAVLPLCEYGVDSPYHAGIVDCAEPATHKVWWEEARTNTLFLCADHFDLVCHCEDEPGGDA